MLFWFSLMALVYAFQIRNSAWTDWNVLISLPNASNTIAIGQSLLTVALISAATLGFGLTALSRWELSGLLPLESLCASYALGYGIASTALFILGIGGFFKPISFFVLTILGLGLLVAFRHRVRWHEFSFKTSLESRVLLLTAIALSLLFLRLSFAPETFYDALQYHLALPQKYLDAGRILPTPENSYSGIPGLPQMMFAWNMVFLPHSSAAPLFHGSTIIWLLLATFGFASRHDEGRVPGLAALSVAATPAVGAEIFRTSVALEWALFEIVAISALYALWLNSEDRPRARGLIIIAGLSIGFALCTKYPAWIIPIAFLPLLRRSGAARGISTQDALAILGLATFFVLPWIAKNFLFYRNPIYPFFHEHIAPPSAFQPDWRFITNANSNLALNVTRFLRAPLDLVVPPIEGVQFSVGFPIILLIPFLWKEGADSKRVLVAVCAIFWATLMLSTSVSRFFIPHLPLLTVLGCLALNGYGLKAINAFKTLCLLLATVQVATISVPDKLRFLSQESDPAAYLSHSKISYPTPIFAGIDFLNKTAPQKENVVLFYGDSRTYYLNRPYLASSDDQAPALESLANQATSAREFAAILRSHGIGSLLVNFGNIARLRMHPRLTQSGRAILSEFWRKYALREFGVKEIGERWVGVYRLLSDDESARPHPFDDIFPNAQ